MRSVAQQTVSGNRAPAQDIDELEDFADYYRTGQHRGDDPFASMEQHSIEQTGDKLSRTLDGFAAMMRRHDDIDPANWVYPVCGPCRQ